MAGSCAQLSTRGQGQLQLCRLKQTTLVVDRPSKSVFTLILDERLFEEGRSKVETISQILNQLERCTQEPISVLASPYPICALLVVILHSDSAIFNTGVNSDVEIVEVRRPTHKQLVCENEMQGCFAACKMSHQSKADILA